MCELLRAIQQQTPFEEFSFEEQRILKECYDAGYFEGVVLIEMISGRIVAEYRHEPRLTCKGLQLLDEVSKQNNGNEPDHTDYAKRERNISQQALKWTKAGVVVAIIFGILGIVATIFDLVFF